MSNNSPAFKVFGYGVAPEAQEFTAYDDSAVKELLADHERRLDTLESLTASFEDALQEKKSAAPLLPNIHDILADKMRGLRAVGVDNNFEADDLKYCAEIAGQAAEGVTEAIQALTPIARAAGVSVETFIDQELSRESARRNRVFQIRAAEIAFRRRIEAASTFDDLTEIRIDIEAFTV